MIKENDRHIYLDLSDEEWAQFKYFCMLDHTSMKGMLRQLVLKLIGRDKQ